MGILLFILGVVLMALAIAVSIALHEVGHLVPAKLFGVRVPQYMIGFGKTIFSWRRGETEYGFKALPLGGYISMIGMYPPGRENQGGRAGGTSPFQQLATDAREADAERILPGRKPSLLSATGLQTHHYYAGWAHHEPAHWADVYRHFGDRLRLLSAHRNR